MNTFQIIKTVRLTEVAFAITGFFLWLALRKVEFASLGAALSAARLGWLRWDFNIEPLGFWRRNDTPDRQGITEIRHIEGLYAMWDELRARHPGLVIDLCASGGRRIDLEALTRGLPLWHSDMQCSGKPSLSADQLQNAGLWRWVPMHGCGNFAYEPSYAFRSAMTAGNILAVCNRAGRFSLTERISRVVPCLLSSGSSTAIALSLLRLPSPVRTKTHCHMQNYRPRCLPPAYTPS